MENIHIGLSHISSCLKAQGHTTRLAVLSSETPARSLELLESIASEFDPQLVCFTAVSTQYPFICEAAQRLKKVRPIAFLFLGGIHASLQPDEAIQGPFDAICIGEGELASAELAAQLAAGKPPQGIRNLWLKRLDGSIEKNPTREFVKDLDQLPFPDREVWHEWVMPSGLTHHVVEPSRGCPYDCAYCSNHALRKLAKGKYVRLRSPERILDEICLLKQHYPDLAHIYLQSETIAVQPRWLDDLTERIRAFNETLEKKIAFACNFRVACQFLNDQIFGALERANVRRMEIGLESGSERVRAEVLRRSYSNEEFFRAFDLARRHGMEIHIYNMIGLPGETLAEHQETIAVNNRVCPDRSLTSIFFPYPGTDLYAKCKAQGLLNEDSHSSAERCRATLDLPGFSRKQIQRAFDWFEYRVYRGHRPLPFRLRKVLKNKISSHAWTHLVFMRLLPLWHALRRR
jgi:anaerobic magnesium-protoporphyrin IX monomethyl ester cyclase